ncbi:BolA family protein [Jannaschia aquimarina]|uniref:Transcriptional regulator BolA n=1 Tax=Jannaschia aquimarina TaxID=935700 RepID=A0A0D1EQ56_9RHOB|nr:BolA family protein [Jannaschia aquimarina]KIT17745.1 transcriptional regulator BolA [Jannaschia aquimarina]SNS96445.1 BolA protein [Jannaschia aquimarina]
MSMEATIRERLQAAFDPREMQVINDSASHAGHAGDDGSGESHWKVAIRAEAFAGKGRVERHRMVHTALGDVMDRIHALSLDLDD